MRIAAGGISHETSTLAQGLTRIRDFEAGMGLFRGEAIFKRFRGSNICMGGFIDGAATHGYELVPLLWGFAYPSGRIAREDYEALKGEFLERLKAADAEERIDGVLLDQHGSMVVEGIDDADGDFIAAVREVVGDRPIVVTTDLHSNQTLKRVAAADAIVGFDTYPHVDMAERGREAAEIIVKTLRGELNPRMAIRQLPLFWGTRCQITGQPPFVEVIERLHELEGRPGILSATVATSFPWADVPEVGSSVIVVADGDQELAQRTADEFGDWIWSIREQLWTPQMTVREGLKRGEEIGKYPIILADQADNTGGGAPGDSTEVLRTFIEMGLEDALILYLVDPETIGEAHRLGVGKEFRAKLGGKSVPMQGGPVEAEVEVMALTDGKFAYDGPMYAGLTSSLGPSAWLRTGGVNIVAVTGRQQPLDQAFARTLGIDCSRMKYICVKSSAHFRSGFEKIAGSIFNIDAAAVHTHDFGKLPHTKRTREVFPVEIRPTT